MILRLLAMAAAHLAVGLGAWALLRSLRTGRPALDAALFQLLRLLLLSAAVLAAGLAGRLDAASLGVAGALAAAGLWLYARPSLRRPALPRPGAFLAAAGILVALRLAAQVWLFSPYVGDTLAYHLPKVAEWTRAGALTLDVGPDPRSWFPAGFELIETAWTVFLRHDVLIELAGVEFLVLGALAAAALAEGAGLDARGRAWAALLYSLTPGVHLGATSCLNDVPAAALVVTVFALVQARARPELALLAAALGLGVKATAGFALPGALLLAWLARREPRLPGGSNAAARAALALAVLVGSFWYARNAVVHGNPIHPMGAAGYVTADGSVLQQAGPSLRSLWRNAVILADSRIYDRGPYGAQLEMVAGWGVAAFAVGLPGLLALGREGGAFGRLALGFLVSLASVFLFSQPDPWNMRFTLFFPALLAVAAVMLAGRIPAFRYVLATAAAVLFVATAAPAELQVDAVRESWKAGWRRRGLPLPYRADTPAASAVVPGANRSYLLYGPDYSGRVLFMDPADDEELVRRMSEAGLRRVHGPESHPAIAAALKSGRLRREPGHHFRLP